MIDLWDRLQSLFNKPAPDDKLPEIDVVSMTPQHLEACLTFFLSRSRELNTALFLADRGDRVLVPSPNVVVEALTDGMLVGALSVDMPCLPALMVFVRSPLGFSLGYEPGQSWDALKIISLFELLRDIHVFAPMAIFELNRKYYTRSQRRQFEITLREYMNEEK